MSIFQKKVGDVKYSQITPNTFMDTNNKNCYYQLDEEWMQREGITSVGNAMYKDRNDNVYTWSDLRVVHRCHNKTDKPDDTDIGSESQVNNPTGQIQLTNFMPVPPGNIITDKSNVLGNNGNYPHNNFVPGRDNNYFPQSDHIPQRPKNDITDRSSVLNNFGVLSKSVLDRSNVLGSRNEVTKKHGGIGDIGERENGGQGNLYTHGYDVPDDNPSNINTDCDRLSYLFIIPLEKNDKADQAAAREFFNFMNERAGGIFQLCQDDGKVLLQKNKNPETVHTSQTTSRILAVVINNAIQGGVKNGASGTHQVDLKVHDPDKFYEKNRYNNEDIKKRIKWNDERLYDAWVDGSVDLADVRNILTEEQPILPERAILLCNEMIQAEMIGHIIYERSSYYPYSNSTPNLNEAAYDEAHKMAVIKGCEIMSEMVSTIIPVNLKTLVTPTENLSTPIENQLYTYDPNDEKYKYKFPIPDIYPLHSFQPESIGAVVAIRFVMVKKPHGPYINYVLSGVIFYDETFVIPKTGYRTEP